MLQTDPAGQRQLKKQSVGARTAVAGVLGNDSTAALSGLKRGAL